MRACDIGYFVVQTVVLSALGTAQPSWPLYELVSWDVEVLHADTPYNSTSLGTYVNFTSPSATQHVLPFYYQPLNRSRDANGSEVLVAAGPHRFVVRFACSMVGLVAYQQYNIGPGGVPFPAGINGTLNCVPPLKPDGFARVDEMHKQYFTLDGVNAFWLVGENMGWPGVWPYFNGSSQWSNGSTCPLLWIK
jgi:hypothetical protein